MAETNNEPRTWQEKLKAGVPLNTLDETKADADFNFKQRLREHKERQAFEARKNAAASAAPSQVASAPANTQQKGE